MPEENGVFVRVVAALLSVAVWSACTATGPATHQASRGAALSRESDGAAERAGARSGDLTPGEDAVARALDRVLERGSWDELHLLAECSDDGFLTSAEVFGNGVTIWNNRRQAKVDHDLLVTLLETLREARFPSLLELYGKGQKEPAPPASALQVICRVALTLDGAAKQSAQRAEGPQSEELKALAWKLLELVRPAEGEGVTAEDLQDGLQKIADGRLAPEAFELVFHRKPEIGPRRPRATPVGLAGFILRIDGRRVAVEEYRAEGGYAEPRVRELDHRSLDELTSLLVEHEVGEMPANLWAHDYTDLVVEVLGQAARVQARQFARMTATTHGAKQERFDRIAAGLEALARETLGVE